MLLGQETSGTHPKLIAKEAVVSMHATHPNSFIQTMRFKGQIGKSSIYALLNSGSTHSFIDPSVLHG
jgi:hypothetical protein